MIEIKAPTFPESIADGAILTWYKKTGEAVKRDEIIVDIETDKVVIEVVSPADGRLEKIIKQEGDTVLSEEVVAMFDDLASISGEASSDVEMEKGATTQAPQVNPSAKKIAAEKGINLSEVTGSEKNGRVTKEDVLAVNQGAQNEQQKENNNTPAKIIVGERIEKRVPMTRLRAKIAERLLSASQDTAMLTTFNEVNMAPVMAIRKKYKQDFEKIHDTRLGFMSFFVRAAVEALKRFPAVNSSIDGKDIVYHGYQDVGIAVSSDRGLVVPVIRDADNMSLAEIESTIRDFGAKAQKGKLSIEEMQGGTFTITNGGVFGSLVSTPILNMPQAAILGMHTIQDRPIAENGEVVIRPMMYLALSYDHRLIDGKDAVQFLVAVKNMIEDPARILLAL
jgi:2-oxoglutarate dehydrogenase E2 component (dihydrolipoamide succinyltransferase)